MMTNAAMYKGAWAEYETNHRKYLYWSDRGMDWSVKSLASHLGVGRRIVHYWLKSGNVPPEKYEEGIIEFVSSRQ